jgi:hypothetical protein
VRPRNDSQLAHLDYNKQTKSMQPKTSYQPVAAQFSQAQALQMQQSQQKSSSMVIRIDNSTAANHQIIKRNKKLKDGSMGAIVSTNSLNA